VTGARATALIAARELRQTSRRKSFWAVLVFLLLGSSAAVILPSVLNDSGVSHPRVAVIGDHPAFVAALTGLEESLDAKLVFTSVPDEAAARLAIEDGDIAIGVAPGPDPVVIVEAGENERLVGAVRQALAKTTLTAQLEAKGLSPAETRDVLAAPPARLVEVDQARSARVGTAIAVSMVLYVMLLTLMVQVANGTAVEKANRISEVLLAIVRPRSLLFGKVIGVGLTGSCVLAAGLLPPLVKLSLGGDLPEGIGGALAGSAAWFLLGLALYLTIAASLGALVERQEEVGSVITPLMAILIATYVVTQGGADSPLGTVLAYVPLTSPIVVPSRIAIGVTSPLELAGSILALLIALALAARIGSTIYGRAIVRTGRRLKLRDVLLTH
jgi:ABC-2 type transport system permease protein